MKPLTECSRNPLIALLDYNFHSHSITKFLSPYIIIKQEVNQLHLFQIIEISVLNTRYKLYEFVF